MGFWWDCMGFDKMQMDVQQKDFDGILMGFMVPHSWQSWFSLLIFH